MADLAMTRRMLIDDSRKDPNTGEKIFKVLPWDLVAYSGGGDGVISGLEMVSIGIGDATKDNGTDREVRGIEFVNIDKAFSLTNHGGGTYGLPKA